MRLFSTIAGQRSIAQVRTTGDNQITPSTAFTDLLRINPIVTHGLPVRVTASIAVNLLGTTLTVRTVFFRLVRGAGAGTTLQGIPMNMDATEAATSVAGCVAMDFLIVTPPPASATEQYALQWSTGTNATADVNGTDPNGGGAVLNVEELGGTGTNTGVLGSELAFDTRQANNPAEILAQVVASFAEVLLFNPNTQLVDIVVSGGGAGQVFLVEMSYRFPAAPDTEFPAVSTLAAYIAFGPDRSTNSNSLNRILVTQQAGEFLYWANACGGDGALWLTILVYVPGPTPPPGPGLLFASQADGKRKVTPGTFTTQLAKRFGIAPSATPQHVVERVRMAAPPTKTPVTGLSMRTSPYNANPPPPTGTPKIRSPK